MHYKKQMFCLEYIQDLNASRAAKAVNLNMNPGDILADAEVQAEIERLLQQRAATLMINADWVVQELKNTVQEARKEKDYGAANNALKLIGEHLGMFNKGKKEAPVLNLNFGRPELPAEAPEQAILTTAREIDGEMDGEEVNGELEAD